MKGPRRTSDVLQKAEAFTDIWNMGLVAFGVHLVLAGYLVYRSAYKPKWLGAVTGIARFGYLFDAATRAVVEDPVFSLSVITGLGEFVLGVWLVSRSHRISLPSRVEADARHDNVTNDQVGTENTARHDF